MHSSNYYKFVKRDKEIMALARRGFSRKEIAARFNMGAGNVWSILQGRPKKPQNSV